MLKIGDWVKSIHPPYEYGDVIIDNTPTYAKVVEVKNVAYGSGQLIKLCNEPPDGEVSDWVGSGFYELTNAPPYIAKRSVMRYYNPDYGDDKICVCGHNYKAHIYYGKCIECAYCDCLGYEESKTRRPWKAHTHLFTKEWPTKPGHYWFYGWTWLIGDYEQIIINVKPKFILVEVHKTGNGLVYVANGNFMYKRERHIGLWTTVEFPAAPDYDFTNFRP